MLVARIRLHRNSLHVLLCPRGNKPSEVSRHLRLRKDNTGIKREVSRRRCVVTAVQFNGDLSGHAYSKKVQNLTTLYNRRLRRNAKIHEVARKLWDSADVDKNGLIDLIELENIILRLYLIASVNTGGVSEAPSRAAIQALYKQFVPEGKRGLDWRAFKLVSLVVFESCTAGITLQLANLYVLSPMIACLVVNGLESRVMMLTQESGLLLFFQNTLPPFLAILFNKSAAVALLTVALSFVVLPFLFKRLVQLAVAWGLMESEWNLPDKRHEGPPYGFAN